MDQRIPHIPRMTEKLRKYREEQDKILEHQRLHPPTFEQAEAQAEASLRQRGLPPLSELRKDEDLKKD